MPGGTRPPDKEVGGRVGLPGSLAALVETSLQENREARPAVDNMSGEQRKGKAAAAGEDLIQVERLEEIELLEDKTPYSVVLRRKGRKGGRRRLGGPTSLRYWLLDHQGSWNLHKKKTEKMMEMERSQRAMLI